MLTARARRRARGVKRRWVPRSSCMRMELDVGGSRGRGSGASCMGGPSSSIFTLGIRLCVTSSCQSFPKSQQSYSSGHRREEAKWTCKSSSIQMSSSPSCESGSGSSSCWTRTGSCKQRPGNSSPVAILLRVNLGDILLTHGGHTIHIFFFFVDKPLPISVGKKNTSQLNYIIKQIKI